MLADDALTAVANVARQHSTLEIDFLIADDGAISMVLEIDEVALTSRLAERGRCFAHGREPFRRFASLEEGVKWLLSKKRVG